MDQPWFCPHCGRPLEARRVADNATGRVGFRAECPHPGHYRTVVCATRAAVERRLERDFGAPDA
ncbi:hypothetical protein [Bifidobacterium myosotis]|uniref:Uncharacterized protein n=1 Tax=Bifidobacterium myosotis TaxID=1630166 RepID=A0A5M9ZHR9_9BIFI|nr:hypothetical protein [Bifidobacterium myosotis]KAA8826995.1 hypothetical protein EMO91_10735 [Bifidobacterium myosotis]